MEYKALAEKIVKMALSLAADEAEVYLENTSRLDLDIRNGEVETVKQAASKGLGLRIFKEQKLGFSYTSDFSPESLDDFTKKTVQLSLVAEPKSWNGLPDLRGGKLKELDLYDPSIAEIPNDKKIEMAKKVEKLTLAYDKRITKSRGGSFSNSEREIILVNSKGVSHSHQTTSVGFSVGAIAGEGNSMQSGSWRSSKRHFKDLDTIEFVAGEAGKRTVEKLGARPVSTQKAPVVFDREVAGGFWSGILTAMDGDSVYKKTTFLTDYLGKQIAPEFITIVDDPLIPRHTSSTPVDGEGNPTMKNVLIEKGILKMYLYDSLTARKAGVKVNPIVSRGGGFRGGGYNSLPSAGALNMVVLNGSENREKIISEIKNGFYVTGLRSRSGVSSTTGTFSSGASGFWIENGEIAFPVDGVTLGGNTLDMLMNIEVLANDLELRESRNCPSFKVSEMTVGGRRQSRA
jgi:PmbA protein